MNKIYDIINSRFSFKKYRLCLVIVLCVGLVLIVIGNMMSKDKTDIDAEPISRETVSDDGDLSEKTLEEKLEKILAEVSGAGKIKVLVSYESTDEKLVLKDSDGRGGETTVIYGGSSENEPFVYKRLSPKISGVLVVAEGGDNIEIKNIIADAVSTILEIPLHKVKVLKMK